MLKTLLKSHSAQLIIGFFQTIHLLILYLSSITKIEYTVPLSIEGSAGTSGVSVSLLPIFLGYRGVHAGQLPPDCANQKPASGQYHGPATYTAHNQGTYKKHNSIVCKNIKMYIS